MRHALALFVPVAVLAPSLAAHAQSQAIPPEIVVEGKRADENKRVCRSAVSTGSILPARTCRTKAQWEEIRQRSIIAMDQVQQDQEAQRHTQGLREAIKDK